MGLLGKRKKTTTEETKEKRKEIRAIINDEQEFVEPDIMQQVTEHQLKTAEDVEEVLNNTVTAIEVETQEVKKIEEPDEIVEIKKGLEEIEEAKKQLTEIVKDFPEKAKEFVTKELEKANELKNKMDSVIVEKPKNRNFSQYWNGQSFDY